MVADAFSILNDVCLQDLSATSCRLDLQLCQIALKHCWETCRISRCQLKVLCSVMEPTVLQPHIAISRSKLRCETLLLFSWWMEMKVWDRFSILISNYVSDMLHVCLRIVQRYPHLLHHLACEACQAANLSCITLTRSSLAAASASLSASLLALQASSTHACAKTLLKHQQPRSAWLQKFARLLVSKATGVLDLCHMHANQNSIPGE